MDARLGKLAQILQDAVSGMSAEELNWHPPDKWCGSEVLEHLYRTYTGTIRGFERVVDTRQSLATSQKTQWRALLVAGLGYFPEGRKSPETAQPRGMASAQVVADIFPAIGRMDEAIARAEATIGRNKKLLDHPILGPLNASQWRKFHLVHARHHAKQLRRLRESCRTQRI
jgi:hypothetical protein